MITTSVLEFSQASSDAAKHFRHSATRENEKRGRKKVGKLDYPPERSKRREQPKLKGILKKPDHLG
ncbi:hypothetical protein GcM1_192002 [Golovinomyces cichoracearum]|uniref:Uncharacterized protein n=1 Tax=Golovinomyces cichoracearum TaxID=62708 RepID=A0A420J0X3_9PEZI|nr:hypothetical protein GcM1_192002 [Golovinomyces cichoracearum]